MKICETCGQAVSEEAVACPTCGGEVGVGRIHIHDYRIVKIVHEGYSSTLCKAEKADGAGPVMIRIFSPQSAVTDDVAYRLKLELEELKKLPQEGFVQHQQLTRSPEGLWYRVSEWVEALNWTDLLKNGVFTDLAFSYGLFSRIASILDILHQTGHFIPHLILSDIMPYEDEHGELAVKIDYKLSRFLNPEMDRPSPMLKNLLQSHPDILHDRPFTFKSDIWSLGKIFVELLAMGYENCNYAAKVDELPLSDQAKLLFKSMLAEDPDLRPGSMAEVARALNELREAERPEDRQKRITEAGFEAAPGVKARHLKRLAVLAAPLLLIAVLAAWLFVKGPFFGREPTLEQYARKYSPSIAFVLADYALKINGSAVYRNQSQGTAFLVDKQGYLLTSRHVVCPWLEDETFTRMVGLARSKGLNPVFEYGVYLWFEGGKAFNRSTAFLPGRELADAFFLEHAYSSRGDDRVIIAGVAKAPVQTRQLLSAPLRDDFAVLKINRVPKGLIPLPLDLGTQSKDIPKLSRIIALGFPLGRRTQDVQVAVSATSGYVRRTFENLIQVDASFYGGNSGGPVIDEKGRVVGIASAVATEPEVGRGGVRVGVTPLRDIAMVLPISKAALFLEEIRQGRAKWNGVFDLETQAKLDSVLAPARKGLWAKAARKIDRILIHSSDPRLITAGGMIHLCARNYKVSRNLFAKAISMDKTNTGAKFMIFVIDWLNGRGGESPYTNELALLDWRSQDELRGHLTRLLLSGAAQKAPVKGWYNRSEKAWIGYVSALVKQKNGDDRDAEALLRQALLDVEAENWESLLIQAKWDEVRSMRQAALTGAKAGKAFIDDVESFKKRLKEKRTHDKRVKERIRELAVQLNQAGADVAEKQRILGRMSREDSENRYLVAANALYLAAWAQWEPALARTRTFLDFSGRESRARLTMGLLEPCLLRLTGQEEAARRRLREYIAQVKDPWHVEIAEGLLETGNIGVLGEEYAQRPEQLLTKHVTFGLWDEGAGDAARALKQYRVALESLLDDWPEYDLARQRIVMLRAAR